MAPNTPAKPVTGHGSTSKTPQSKHRLHLNGGKNALQSPNPSSAVKQNPTAEHPVEVIGRIRDHPDRKEKPISALKISADGQTIRVRTDIGYRDFILDGVSVSEDEDLDEFYKKFVEPRINDVKLGAKCTIMMYGPTGSGKSHTMFGCSKQPGIVYRALRAILGEGDEENETAEGSFGYGSFVHVTVLEIYNEEIYDLLSNNNGGGLSLGWPKGSASKVRLEVMGKKAKNATFISGNEAAKISREVAKVEKRRIVKSTLCNERSSRSHCLIILDVPAVGGRLMLVDMAGSENIEQAGQAGFEAKMQTAKINQGNIALKRVVESIANGDSYVPFRDSKLTMLLQDSFEDDKSKILMILCASPDPKEIHKTISTLEYGAKAKCIVRGAHTPNSKDRSNSDDSSSTVLGSRIAAMDQFIYKLQMENKLKQKERDEAHKELVRKEKEVAELRARLEKIELGGSAAKNEEIDVKVNERTKSLKLELEKKLMECQKMEKEFAEMGKKMEEKILQQQEDVEMLRRRLEEIESELCQSRENDSSGVFQDLGGSNFMKRLSEIYANGDQGMEKSMDLDLGDPPTVVKEINDVHKADNVWNGLGTSSQPLVSDKRDGVELSFADKVYLSTVFEGEKEGEDTEEEEVEKSVVEKSVVEVQDHGGSHDDSRQTDINVPPYVTPLNLARTPKSYCRDFGEVDYKSIVEKTGGLEPIGELENSKEAASARRTRIQNIFMLCGNHRELAQHVRFPTPAPKRADAEVQSSPATPNEDSMAKTKSKEFSPLKAIRQPEFGLKDGFPSDGNAGIKNIMAKPISALLDPFSSLCSADELKSADTQLSRTPSASKTLKESKENDKTKDEDTDGMVEVYVKWEASKECPGKFITKLKVLQDSSLADLRKLIEANLGTENSMQAFSFLMLGDPTGAPVTKENEATVQASKLPICNNHVSSHLACLRPVKKIQKPDHIPFSSLENRLPFTSNSPSTMVKQGEGFSPTISQKLGNASVVVGLPI